MFFYVNFGKKHQKTFFSSIENLAYIAQIEEKIHNYLGVKIATSKFEKIISLNI